MRQTELYIKYNSHKFKHDIEGLCALRTYALIFDNDKFLDKDEINKYLRMFDTDEITQTVEYAMLGIISKSTVYQIKVKTFLSEDTGEFLARKETADIISTIRNYTNYNRILILLGLANKAYTPHRVAIYIAGENMFYIDTNTEYVMLLDTNYLDEILSVYPYILEIAVLADKNGDIIPTKFLDEIANLSFT